MKKKHPISSKQGDDPKKGRSKHPKRGGGSKSKGFMHAKSHSQRLNVPLTSVKEETLIANGHCFLLRNLRKVTSINAIFDI